MKKRIKKILEKIKYYFKKMIKKENILLIEENNDILENVEQFKNNPHNIETDKKEFFELYKKVKSGTVPIENLMIDDMIKVLLMMKNEVSVLDDKINCSENDIISLENEIKILETEHQTMRKNKFDF